MTKYKAKPLKINGWLNLEFDEAGLLRRFESRLKGALTDAQVAALRVAIPRHEEELPALTNIGFVIEQLEAELPAAGAQTDPVAEAEPKKTNPVAIWCAGYNANHLAPYKVSGAEAGMLKANASLVTAELLEVYMKSSAWWASPKSVSSFIKNINEVREQVAIAANQPKAKRISDARLAELKKKQHEIMFVKGPAAMQKAQDWEAEALNYTEPDQRAKAKAYADGFWRDHAKLLEELNQLQAEINGSG